MDEASKHRGEDVVGSSTTDVTVEELGILPPGPGLFGVNMTLLYGEGGERAFVRLQHEIAKITQRPEHLCLALRTDHTGGQGKECSFDR